MTSLRAYTGKHLVAMLRGGDFAHAGGALAIEQAMAHCAREPEQRIADIGCGLGGTAAYLQEQGWGRVVGIDIEQHAITYAKQTYPQVDFFACDVLDVDQCLMGRQFDLFCLFNSFYAFTHQTQALQALSKLAAPQAKLIIFDYTDRCYPKVNPLYRPASAQQTPFIPLQLELLPEQLIQTHWQLQQIIEVSDHYGEWYQTLLTTLQDERSQVIAQFGEEMYRSAMTTYQAINTALQAGDLGGAIVYATLLNHPTSSGQSSR